ncbi:hypothetical protein PY650_34880 [Rhizobium calliandrae]|uniref:Uncharacterized protein n=1 Tax=Rhizobium calliandrae TaxID=1312182 RepID=A0ABT7KPX3_9HYPH|nr:hypothetical protein [Rhizobium calliandrae]MDL2410665.1 hypothetical protein [Rhizobium calliandrae]
MVSPVYGTIPARAFFETLHADTISAEVKIRTIYVAEDGADRIIAHFGYRWERRLTPTLDTYVLDLFELTPDAQIKRIRIILDGDAATAA